MALLTKERFLASFNRRVQEVDTPAGLVYIRNLTEAEYGELSRDAMKKDGKPNPQFAGLHRRRLVAAVLCDADGTPWFSPHESVGLADLDAGTVQAIYLAAVAHCGLRAGEEAEKNSDEIPG